MLFIAATNAVTAPDAPSAVAKFTAIALVPVVLPAVLNSKRWELAPFAAPAVLVAKFTVIDSPSAGMAVISILPADAYTLPELLKRIEEADFVGGSTLRSHWLFAALVQT